MAPFTRPSAKKRRIAAKGKTLAKRLTSNNQQSQPTTSSPLYKPSSAPDEPEVVLDDLDSILEPPADSDDAMELHDNGEVQAAVATSQLEMKLNYDVVLLDGEAKEARDLFPKVFNLLCYAFFIYSNIHSPYLNRWPGYRTISTSLT
jgi:hypothetical protein